MTQLNNRFAEFGLTPDALEGTPFEARDNILRQAQRTMPHRESEQAEDADGNLTEFGKALRRGFLHLSTNAKFLGSMLVGVFGAQGARDWLIKSAIESRDDAASERLRGKVQRLEDIDSAMDVGTFVLNAFGEQFPNILLMFATGGIAGAIGKTVAQKAAVHAAGKLAGREALRKGGKKAIEGVRAMEELYARTGALAGAGAVSVGLETGTIGVDIAQETGQFRPGVAMSFGSVAGAIDALPFAPLFKKLGVMKPAKEFILKDFVDRKVLKTFVKGGTRQFFYEGPTEVAQSLIENAALKYVDSDHTIFEGHGMELLNAFTIGGIVGGMTGGAVEVASRAQTRGALKRHYNVNSLHTAYLEQSEPTGLSPEQQSMRKARLDDVRELRFNQIDPRDVPRRVELLAENEVMTELSDDGKTETVVGQRKENVGGVELTFVTDKFGTLNRLKQILYPEEWTQEHRLRWLSHRRGDIGLQEDPDVTNAEKFEINIRERLEKADKKRIKTRRADVVKSLGELYDDPQHVDEVMTVVDSLVASKVAVTPGLSEDDVINQMFDKVTSDPLDEGANALYSGTGNDSDVFYSRLRQRIVDTKFTKMPADQLVRTLQKASGNVSREELVFTGMLDFLQDKGKEKVDKADVLNFLEQNHLTYDTVMLDEFAILDVVGGDNLPGGTNRKQIMFRWFPPHLKNLADISTQYERQMAKLAKDMRISFRGVRNIVNNFMMFRTNDPTSSDVSDLLMSLRANYSSATMSTEHNTQVFQLWDTHKTLTERRSALHVQPTETFTEGHFEVDNVFGHVRAQDFTLDGKRTLVVDEFQSQWASKIQRMGGLSRQEQEFLKNTPSRDELVNQLENRTQTFDETQTVITSLEKRLESIELRPKERTVAEQNLANHQVKLDNIRKDLARISQQITFQETLRGRVPDMPFSDKYVEMQLKYMIRYAAEHGYDQIAWTHPDVQIARWSSTPNNKLFYSIYKEKPSKALRKINKELGTDLQMRQTTAGRGDGGYAWKEMQSTIRAAFGEETSLDVQAANDFIGWLEHRFEALESPTLSSVVEVVEDVAAFGVPMQDVYLKVPDQFSSPNIPGGTRIHATQVFPDEGTNATSVLKSMALGMKDPKVFTVELDSDTRHMALRGVMSLMSPTARAAVQFNQLGQATVHVFQNASVQDGVHEVLHIARRMLFGEDLQIVEDHLGVKNGVWTREAEEQFVSEAMAFIPKGEAKSPKMQGVFQRFWNWFRSLFGMARDNGVEVNKTFAGAMDRLFGRTQHASDVSAASTQHDIDRLSGHERRLLQDEITVAKETNNLEFYQDPPPLTPETIAARENAGTLVKLTNNTLVDPPSRLKLITSRFFSTGPNAIRKLAPKSGDKLATLLESFAENVRQKLNRSEQKLRKIMPVFGEVSAVTGKTGAFNRDERSLIMDVMRGNKVSTDARINKAAKDALRHLRLMEGLARRAKFMVRNPLNEDVVKGSFKFKKVHASAFRMLTDDARRQLHERKGPLYEEMLKNMQSQIKGGNARQAQEVLFAQFSLDGDASFIPFERQIVFDLPDKFFIQDAREYMDKMAMGFWKRYYEIKNFGYSTMGRPPRDTLETENDKARMLAEITREGGRRAGHFASDVYNEVLGRLGRADWITQMEDHFLRPMRLFNAIRLLGLAVNPFAKQLTQPAISGIPKFGFINFIGSIYDLMSGRGPWKTVMQSGAIDTQTLDRLVQGQTTGTGVQKGLEKVARVALLPFKLGDQAGRIVAAQQGVRAAQKYLQGYKTGRVALMDKLTITKAFASKRQVKRWYKEQLEDLGVRNVEAVVKRGKFSRHELENIAQKSSDLLLFQTGPTDLPAGWSASPLARTLFQFYTFAWKQAALASSFVTKEAWQRSNYLPITRLVIGSNLIGAALIGATKSFTGEDRLETEQFKEFWNNYTFIGSWGLVMDLFDAEFDRIRLGPTGDLAQALVAETTKVINTEIDDIGKQLKQSSRDLWQSQVSLVKTINKKKRGDLRRQFDTWTAQVATSKKQAKATGVIAATGVFPTSGQRSPLWKAAQSAADGGNEDKAYDAFELEMKKRLRSGSKIESVTQGLLRDRSPTSMYVELDLAERKIFNRAYGSPLTEGESQTMMYDANASFVLTALKAGQFAQEFVRNNKEFIVEQARRRGKN
ncbi:MAG: hypothetical protein Unbinned400contig1000_32 [Prokaryotic dsDNA virus sp.]|nr:MAG: hypothetical protein Unbinned400contig1000_32 [Prokaryotic dsDNA virus sp.]|tara:strand:+ start:23344 stop:29793 length:6450 start_codon:yes stop_codon:yes gene_type:complete